LDTGSDPWNQDGEVKQTTGSVRPAPTSERLTLTTRCAAPGEASP